MRSSAANAYIYSRWRATDGALTIELGLAGDRYRQEHSPGPISVSRNDLSPKFGLAWSPRLGSALRLAAFFWVKRRFVSSQTIEPTQVAGFNQFFSGYEQLYGEVEGTVLERAGIGFDQTFAGSIFGGVEAAKRDLDVASLGVDGDFNWDEWTGLAYLYKTFSFARWSGAATLDGEYEKIERPQVLTGSEGHQGPGDDPCAHRRRSVRRQRLVAENQHDLRQAERRILDRRRKSHF